MKNYCDTSALAKRYIIESGSERLQQYFQEGHIIGCSALCLAEMISALCRLQRERAITPAEYRRLKSAFQYDVATLELIDIEPLVLQRTIECLESKPLKALDAIHIASALYWQCDRFLTADRQQATAARALHLDVVLI